MSEKNYTKAILKRYLIRMEIYALALFGSELLAYLLLRRRVWQSQDPLWEKLHWAHERIGVLTILVLCAGALFFALLCIRELSAYIQSVAGASEHLLQDMETPVILPDAIKTIQDRLNDLRQQALRKDYEAREAEQRKNDLIVYLAHDLKTPLTSVIGYLSLLRDEPDLAESMRERYTGIALSKAEHLEDLINDFFEITRFNLTVMTLEKEKIDLSLMIEQIASEFEPILAEKDIGCKTELEPGVQVQCDPGKLERVLDNLIRNAINYSYPETTIRICLRRKSDRVQIQVSNQGRTIPEESLKRVFEKFFRLDSSRSSSTGGAGLGLAIAKEIVERHGGVIQAESRDEITVFTVELPV